MYFWLMIVSISSFAVGISLGVKGQGNLWSLERDLSVVTDRLQSDKKEEVELGGAYSVSGKDYAWSLYASKSIFSFVPMVECFIGVCTPVTKTVLEGKTQINHVYYKGAKLSQAMRERSHFGELKEKYIVHPFCLWDLLLGVNVKIGCVDLSVAAGGRYTYMGGEMRINQANTTDTGAVSLNYENDAVRAKPYFHIFAGLVEVSVGWKVIPIPFAPVLRAFCKIMLPREIGFNVETALKVNTFVESRYPAIMKMKRFGVLKLSGYEVGLALEVGF